MDGSVQVYPAKEAGYFIALDGKPIASTYNPIKEGKRLQKTFSIEADYFLFLGISPLYQWINLKDRTKRIWLIEYRFDLERHLDTILRGHPDLREEIEAGLGDHIFILNPFHKHFARDVEKALLEIDVTQLQIVDKNKSNHFRLSLSRRLIHRAVDGAIKNRQTEAYFNNLWLKNARKNLDSRPFRWIDELDVKAGAALLIGSGLSLEGMMEDIKKKENFFLIFSLPGILPLLDRFRITPHFIVATDASFYNDYHFHWIYRRNNVPPLLCPLSICPSIPRHYPGKVYFFIDDEYILKWILQAAQDETTRLLINKMFFPMRGSVTIQAIQILAQWGIPMLATAGVDFFVTPFRSHSPSNTTEEWMFNEGTRLRPFENRYHWLYFYSLTLSHQGWQDSKNSLYERLYLQELKRHPFRITAMEEVHEKSLSICGKVSHLSIEKEKVKTQIEKHLKGRASLHSGLKR